MIIMKTTSKGDVSVKIVQVHTQISTMIIKEVVVIIATTTITKEEDEMRDSEVVLPTTQTMTSTMIETIEEIMVD